MLQSASFCKNHVPWVIKLTFYIGVGVRIPLVLFLRLLLLSPLPFPANNGPMDPSCGLFGRPPPKSSSSPLEISADQITSRRCC